MQHFHPIAVTSKSPYSLWNITGIQFSFFFFSFTLYQVFYSCNLPIPIVLSFISVTLMSASTRTNLPLIKILVLIKSCSYKFKRVNSILCNKEKFKLYNKLGNVSQPQHFWHIRSVVVPIIPIFFSLFVCIFIDFQSRSLYLLLLLLFFFVVVVILRSLTLSSASLGLHFVLCLSRNHRRIIFIVFLSERAKLSFPVICLKWEVVLLCMDL